VNPAKPAPVNAQAATAKRDAVLSAGVAIENKKWGLITAPKWEMWHYCQGSDTRSKYKTAMIQTAITTNAA